MSVSASTSKTPFPFSRAVRSARRMSILPWRSRRWNETSFSSSVSCSISVLRSSSESVARSGSGSMTPFRWRTQRAVKQHARRGVNLSLRLLPSSRRERLSLHDLLDQLANLLLELLRRLERLSLGVEVHHRLVRIGQNLRPASVSEQLDPVREVEIAA